MAVRCEWFGRHKEGPYPRGEAWRYTWEGWRVKEPCYSCETEWVSITPFWETCVLCDRAKKARDTQNAKWVKPNLINSPN